MQEISPNQISLLVMHNAYKWHWLSCFRMTKEEEIVKEGGERQSVLSEPRLSEAVEMYKELGFEVRVEPVDLECMDEDCKECFVGEDCKVIYTRKRTI